MAEFDLDFILWEDELDGAHEDAVFLPRQPERQLYDQDEDEWHPYGERPGI